MKVLAGEIWQEKQDLSAVSIGKEEKLQLFSDDSLHRKLKWNHRNKNLVRLLDTKIYMQKSTACLYTSSN